MPEILYGTWYELQKQASKQTKKQDILQHIGTFHTNDKGGQEIPVGFMGPISGTELKIVHFNQCRVQKSDTELEWA